MNRRDFVQFLGKGTLAIPLLQVGLSGCRKVPVMAIDPSFSDAVLLTDGLEYKVLIKWGDKISDKDYFGYDNDFLAFVQTKDGKDLLWINHEYVNPLFVSGHDSSTRTRLRKEIEVEMYNVGGSVLRMKNSWGDWSFVENDFLNKRVTGETMIPFEWYEGIQGSNQAMGTVANCAGGVTPWGTILTCEENYDDFYGEYDYLNERFTPSIFEWESFTGNPCQHYGWVVEVDPVTGVAKKQVAMGRFAHESATVVPLKDGRVVIYSGDDQVGGCLYKYISSEPGKIYPGALYVANFDTRRWEKLDYERNELNYLFSSETEMMIRTREAALAVGGTPLDRPEDIAIDPLNGHILMSLTNNKPKGNYLGSIIKIVEEGGDYEAMSFTSETFLSGGEDTGFACPDNLEFDKAGNLWFTSDISSGALGKAEYEPYGNNGLYVAIRNGELAGKVIQVASAPRGAEFSGPCFAPDGKTLLLCVQHPGEGSSVGFITSHWPEGGESTPKPAVIAISGDFIDTLIDFEPA